MQGALRTFALVMGVGVILIVFCALSMWLLDWDAGKAVSQFAYAFPLFAADIFHTRLAQKIGVFPSAVLVFVFVACCYAALIGVGAPIEPGYAVFITIMFGVFVGIRFGTRE